MLKYLLNINSSLLKTLDAIYQSDCFSFLKFAFLSALLIHSILLVDGVLIAAVVASLWVWNGSSLSIGKGESLVEVWAVLKASDVSTDFAEVLSIEFLLNELPLFAAVEADLWVWDSLGLAVSESESLIEVWAVWKGINTWSPVWCILLLSELPLLGAVEANLWVWDSLGLAVSESESLIEVWAVWKGINTWSPVWCILLLSELPLLGAVESNFWVWDSSGLAIGEGESLVKVWAVWK